MNKKLLITDTFFISAAHEQRLIAGGYDVIRLHKPSATEDQLIEALKGVAVYIIGGTEIVSKKVIESTDTLEAIIFSGVDYAKYIPDQTVALNKGIKLLNAPGANATAVAEFAIGVSIAMQRQLFTIGRTGTSKFITTKSLQDSNIGVIGAGNIGQKIIDCCQAFKPHQLVYYNRSEKNVDATRVSIDELVQQSDIIFLTLPMGVGTLFNAELISKIKNDSLLVSVSPTKLIDYDALLTRLHDGSLRAAHDWPAPNAEYDKLSLDTWFSFNSHSAYNTVSAIKAVDDSVVDTAISLLQN